MSFLFLIHNLQSQNQECVQLPALLQLEYSSVICAIKAKREQCGHACMSHQCLGDVMFEEHVFQSSFVRCHSLLETYVHTAASAWEMSTNTPLPCRYLTGHQQTFNFVQSPLQCSSQQACELYIESRHPKGSGKWSHCKKVPWQSCNCLSMRNADLDSNIQSCIWLHT